MISRAEVAEVGFTAFARARRPSRSPGGWSSAGSRTSTPPPTRTRHRCSTLWRFHTFFTTSDPDVLDTVAADKTHRGHAIIEQVHADLKDSALAHLPSGKFMANSAWLVLAVMTFNLTRAAGTLAGGRFSPRHSGTIRRTLISVPARVASSARKMTLHLPKDWPWERQWTELFTRTSSPPAATTS